MIKHLFIALLAVAALPAVAQTPLDVSDLDGSLNFYVANDLGRNGYYDQKPIADLMGRLAEQGADPECVVAAGDVHHFEGVASVSDPLWLTNFELVYSHPELHVEWFPILGNHEYRGNTQAVLDYSAVSRRWVMPARYYSKVLRGRGVRIRLVLIDTTPLIAKYRAKGETYPDAGRQDAEAQLAWLDKTLAEADEDWVVVVGHHPVYAQTAKDRSEREDMQALVDPILRRHNVPLYVCGHIHNFQHIRAGGSTVDYVVNSSASLARKVKPQEGTLFCSPEPGFSIVSATAERLTLRMVDKDGNVLHVVQRTK